MLSTVASLAADLGVSAESEAARLERLLTQASAAIERATNRQFARTRRVDRVLGEGARTLVLPRTPIVAVHSILCDGTPILDWRLADPGLGFVERRAGWGWRTGGVWWGEGPSAAATFEVDCTAGYALPGTASRDLPDDIERACLDLAKAWWWAQSRDPAASAEAFGGNGIGYALQPGMPAGVAELLRPWIRRV